MMSPETGLLPFSEETLTNHLVGLLQAQGYQAQSGGSGMIRSASSGLRFAIFVQQDGWLQFYLSVEVSRTLDARQVAQDFNRQYRFGKVYLDSDGDIVLSADFLLFLDDASRLETLFEQYVSLWNSMIGRVMMAIREATPSPQPAGAAS